jgi:3-hydroxybutyryl-CoA dehydrogenase
MSIESLAVCGAGIMGSGIAQVAAMQGIKVVLVDVTKEVLDRGLKNIHKSLDRFVAKNVISAADSDLTFSRIECSTDPAKCSTFPFIIEAVNENIQTKSQLYRQLAAICTADAILASNTSSISITKLAAFWGRPDRFIGMHFMNPVPLMTLVELVRGAGTSQATYEATEKLALTLKKTAVEVNDSPGFVSNRILIPMINEAVFALMEGVAKAEAIDSVMKLGMNHPMGPLALADLIGLDVCLDIMNVLYEGFKDSKYRPCPLLQKMVDAGYLGRKTGRGFYDYNGR